ncbi:glycosyltransferase [Brevibacterium casei]|nr:glycosyltransferase [Brevibacterium casei]
MVSVIVPVYNGASNLRSTVASVLAQRYCGFELILVDDGSTDSSGALIDGLAEADARIRALHQPNQGSPRPATVESRRRRATGSSSSTPTISSSTRALRRRRPRRCRRRRHRLLRLE